MDRATQMDLDSKHTCISGFIYKTVGLCRCLPHITIPIAMLMQSPCLWACLTEDLRRKYNFVCQAFHQDNHKPDLAQCEDHLAGCPWFSKRKIPKNKINIKYQQTAINEQNLGEELTLSRSCKMTGTNI